MISKNLQKFIRSLELKKNRQREGLFVAEGPKVVGDLLATFSPRLIVATDEWAGTHACDGAELQLATADELRRLSFLQHPQQVLAVFHMPAATAQPPSPADHLLLALDGVQDPGNLGTIIRIADWFGIDTLLCSRETADAYNPKVVQATMGSLARVHLLYIDLEPYLASLPQHIPLYGTFIDGTDIYSQQLSSNGIIVMGNEGNGISPAVGRLLNRRLLIPHYAHTTAFGTPTSAPDSLNVAIATAITCAEFRRRSRP